METQQLNEPKLAIGVTTTILFNVQLSKYFSLDEVLKMFPPYFNTLPAPL